MPRAIDVEAHQYPRKWKRNAFYLYSGVLLLGFQLNRYVHLCRVSLTFLTSELEFLWQQSTMRNGEYMDWGSHHAPKRLRFD